MYGETPSKPVETMLELNKFERDTGTQTRQTIDSDKVDEYAEAMKEDVIFPPVTVYYDGKHYFLADGWHRWHATEVAGKNKITCSVYKGTKRDAVWHALGANSSHGMPLTSGDKRKAVEIALADREWACLTDREIARHCGCSKMTVCRIRKEQHGENVTMLQNSLASKVGTEVADGSVTNQSPPIPSEPTEGMLDADDPADDEEDLITLLADPFRESLKYLGMIKALMKEQSDDPEMVGQMARKITRITDDLQRARNAITSAMPVEWCDKCHRHGCEKCLQTGWLTRLQVSSDKARDAS